MKPTRLLTLIAVLSSASLALAGPLENLTAAQANNARPGVNVLRVAAAVVDTETVTINGHVFEVDTTSAASITTGNIRLNLSGGSTAAATQTLTSDNTNVANTETVTIGSKVYTFKTSLTPTEGEVLIGASADASLLNLIRAVNHSGTAGTDYQAAAANTQVSAATSVTSHTFAVTALIPGAGANSIATTETSAHLSWGSTTLASGVSPTAGEFTTALNTAVNAGAYGARSTRVSANEVLIVQARAGTPAIACTETLAGSNNAWAAATTFGMAATPDNLGSVHLAKRTATATEAALETMHFAFPFAPSGAVVQITTSGVPKAWDGAVTITGTRVDLASSGSTDIASGDVVTILASE